MKPGLTLPSPPPKRLTSDTVPYLSLFQCASFQGNQDWSMKKDRPEKDWPVLTCTTFPCFSVPAMAAALWVCDVSQPAVQPRRGHVGDAGGGAMEGACHARRGDHGVGPPHQGVPHQPSACLICHLTQDWLLHPSLMSLWCGTSPPLSPNTHGVDTSCQTSSQTGSSIQVWCRCGVEPPPLSPNTHTHHVRPLPRLAPPSKSDVAAVWNLSPHIMSNLFTETGSSIQVWCRCGVEPPPLPNTHTHHVRPLHRLAPPSKSDVAVVWNLPPISPNTHTHHVRPLHRLAPPSKSDVAAVWKLSPHIMSNLFTETGSSIQVWCCCGVEPPPPNTHIMSDLFTDWLLHPSLMSLRCGTSPPLPQNTRTSCQTSSQTGFSIQVWCRCGVEPPPLSPNTHTHHVRPLHRLAPPSKSDVAAVWNLSPHIMSNLFTETGSSIQVWCCCGVEPPPPSPPKHTHIMSDLFTDWLLHPSLMSLWNGTAPHPLHHVRPLHRMASQVWCHCGVEPLPTHYVKPLHKLAPPFKADVTMCGISQQPPSQFIDCCLEDWLLHPSFMSKWCGTHLSPPTPPPSPPNTRMPFMLCHFAKDWYLHSSVMSPWWTSFTLRQWLYWRLAPPFQADDADFCGS